MYTASTGALVSSRLVSKIKGGKLSVDLDVSTFPPGLYVVAIRTALGVNTKKLVINE